MNHTFDLFDTISVQFSGGKDSTAVLNLVLQVAAERNYGPVDVVFCDEEAIFTENADYVARVGARPDVNLRWLTIPVRHRNATSFQQPYWYPWAPEHEDKWCRPIPTGEGVIRNLDGYDYTDPYKRLSFPQISGMLYDPKEFGQVGLFLGIRAQESMTRFRAVSRKTEENYIIPVKSSYGVSTINLGWGNTSKSYPIYDWKTDDVWGAPKRLGWDYCRVYDQMDKMGISPNNQRIAPPYGEQPMKCLHQFQQIEPQMWDKVSARVHGASTGMRYGNTVLYGMGALPNKPKDEEWPEFILRLAGRHSPRMKKVTLARIRQEIKVHYSKTTDPVLALNPHPDTGMSWQHLIKIALRSDEKQRMQAGMNVEAVPSEAVLKAYAEELALYNVGEYYNIEDMDIKMEEDSTEHDNVEEAVS